MKGIEDAMATIVPPFNFAMVCSRVYRSAFPVELNYAFLRTLNLGSIICLSPKLLEGEGAALVGFCADEGIVLHQLDVGENREPFMEMTLPEVDLAVAVAAEKANYPVLIMCVSGKNRTGVVVGCLRKAHHRWSLVAIFDELARFLGPSKLNLLDQQFVESF